MVGSKEGVMIFTIGMSGSTHALIRRAMDIVGCSTLVDIRAKAQWDAVNGHDGAIEDDRFKRLV
jgi:hypothetical protein